VTAFLGISACCACAPLNPAYRSGEFDFFLEDVDARALVIQAGLDSPVRQLAHQRGITVIDLDTDGHALRVEGPGVSGGDLQDAPCDDDTALVLHTSGTTARPKIVPLSHRNLVASAENIAATLALGPVDRCLNVMPLFHIHGIVGAALASLSAGASVACAPGFHPARFFAWLEELEPTWYTAVPTIHQAILARIREDPGLAGLAHLRFVRSSSAALPPAVLAELEEVFGAPAIEAYGMTEAAHQMASNPLPPGVRKPGSVGIASGPQIAVLDGAGDPVAAGVVGETAVRGPTVFSGYEANPAANEAAFTGGWFRTGDEGAFDDDGYLFLRGRLKEIINRGGEKISPLEVDNALLRHPAVAEAVSFGFPHVQLGEDIAAAVVLRPRASVSETDLQVFAASILADFKVPRLIRFVPEIPKGPTGKLRRIGLAEALGIEEGDQERPDPSASFEPPRTERERELVALFEDVLGQDRIGRDDSFFECGGDSILAAELVTRLRGSGLAAADAPLAMLVWAPTPRRLAAWLDNDRDAAAPILVTLQQGGARRPVFFLPGGDGDVVPFVRLAASLGPDQPVHAFRSSALDREGPRSLDVSTMAGEYVDALLAIDPTEPIILGAICVSAPIALEMAARLQSLGRQVAPPLLVDPLPGAWDGQPRLLSRLARSRLWSRVNFHLRQGRLYQLRQPGSWKRIARSLWARLREGGGSAVTAPIPDGAVDIARSVDLASSMDDARRRYRYGVHHGRIVVLHSHWFPTSRRLWARLAAAGLDWVEVPVEHPTMLLQPEVAALGDAMRAALDEMVMSGGPVP